jgi:hypothetical protein
MIREDGENQENLKNLMQEIRREGQKLMQKGSQADNEAKARQESKRCELTGTAVGPRWAGALGPLCTLQEKIGK